MILGKLIYTDRDVLRAHVGVWVAFRRSVGCALKNSRRVPKEAFEK
jgi:hypothetical protein